MSKNTTIIYQDYTGENVFRQTAIFHTLLMAFSDMFFQIKISTKSFITKMANKWFGIRVRMHVRGQIVQLMESLSTKETLASFFVGMSQFMIFIISLLMETLSTVFTLIHFDS